MGLWFQNAYSDPVYVAILWYDPSCSGQPWRKSGWYLVASGSSVEIVGANLQSIPDSNFAWFAQADWADGPCWSGDPAHNWYAIPHNAAFDQCYSNNTGCNAAYPLNTATLSRSSVDWTIVLLQPGVAGRGFQGCSYGFAGQPTAHLLNFTVPAQLESLWCWAAVSTGVAYYYNSASTVTQCQVVNAQLGRTDCCRNPSSSNCNVTDYLDKAPDRHVLAMVFKHSQRQYDGPTAVNGRANLMRQHQFVTHEASIGVARAIPTACRFRRRTGGPRPGLAREAGCRPAEPRCARGRR
jgi:hypothetical protein